MINIFINGDPVYDDWMFRFNPETNRGHFAAHFHGVWNDDINALKAYRDSSHTFNLLIQSGKEIIFNHKIQFDSIFDITINDGNDGLISLGFKICPTV